MPERHPCGYFEGGGHCGVLTERRYLPGFRCPNHTPARVAGRPEDAPDPDRTVAGLAKRRLQAPDQSKYGPRP